MTNSTAEPSLPVPPLLPTRSGGRRWSGGDWMWAVALWMVAVSLYAQTRRFDFIYFDDQYYVARNPYVQQGMTWAGLRAAFTGTVVDNWHPVTVVVELALSSLFGPSASTFHVANALLHGAVIAGLFAFLRLATGRVGPSLAVAALWGLHPLRVESVAWVAELKDELSGVAWVAGLLAYVAYVHRRTFARYGVLVVVFALALMSKPTTVTFPFALLLADYWPLGGDRPTGPAARGWWGRRIGEKLPLLALAAAVAVITVRAQRSLAILVRCPLEARVANAVASVWTYTRQSFWPTGLAVFYPHPWYLGHGTPTLAIVAGGALIVGGSAVALVCARRAPFLLVGWFWFIGGLVPTIGLLQAGEQARADRFTYLPTMGLTFAVVWLFADLATTSRARRLLGGSLAVLIAGLLGWGSARLCESWRDAESIWTRANAVVPDNYKAMQALADLYVSRGEVDVAMPLARRAADLAGDRTVSPRVTLGMCLLATGRDADVAPAIGQFLAAVKIRGTDASAWLGLGQALGRQANLFVAEHRPAEVVNRRVTEAATAYRNALSLDPDDAQSADLLAQLLATHGRRAEAFDVWRALLDRFPADATAQGDLAAALQASGRPDAAIEHYRIAVRNGDARPGTRSKFAWLLARDARSTVEELASVAPLAKQACDDAGAGRQPFPWYAYAVVLARLDRFDDATAAAQRALALARSTGQAGMATAIQDQLAAFQQGLVALPTTRPATMPVLGPTTRG